MAIGELYCLLAIFAFPSGEALLLLTRKSSCSLKHLLGVGLWLLNSLLLGLGERGVQAGHDLLAPLHHQEQLVSSLSNQFFGLLMVQVEYVMASNLDKVVPRLGSGMRGNAIQRHLQKLERQASVFATLKSESPWLAGRLP